MAGNRPRSRAKNITGVGKSVFRRGGGLGTGPVSASGGFGGAGRGTRSFGRRSSPLTVIIVILALIFGGTGIFGDDTDQGGSLR